jgi:hypothetical protein
MLQAVSGDLPASTLWFGFFISIHPNTDVMTIGNCLGRHLVQRLSLPVDIFGSPTSDISLDEFEILSENFRKGVKFRTDQQSTINIEIFPGIRGNYRLSRGVRSDQEKTDKYPNYEELRELRYIFERANKIIGKLELDQNNDLFGQENYRKRRVNHRNQDDDRSS